MSGRVLLAIASACVLGACAGRETELTSPCLGPGAPRLPGGERVAVGFLDSTMVDGGEAADAAAAGGVVVVGEAAALEAAWAAGLLGGAELGGDVAGPAGAGAGGDAGLAATFDALAKGCDFAPVGSS